MRDNPDLVNEFLEDCEARYSPRTVKNKRVCLRRFEDYLQNKSIAEATLGEIREFLSHLKEKGRASGTISNYLSTIKGFFRWIELHHGEIEDIPSVEKLNPNDYPSQPWESFDRSPLSRDEVRDLINSTDNCRDALAIGLMYYPGLRAGEIVRLRLGGVDTERRMLGVIGKGNVPRCVPYHSDLDRLVDQYLERERRNYVNSGDSGYFLVSKRGGQLSISALRRIVRKVAQEAGIQEVIYEKPNGNKIWKVSPHILRVTFVHHACEDRVPIGVIKKILGHQVLMTTRAAVMSEEYISKSYSRYFKGPHPYVADSENSGTKRHPRGKPDKPDFTFYRSQFKGLAHADGKEDGEEDDQHV